MGGSNGELEDLTNRLVDRATASGMEVSSKDSNMPEDLGDEGMAEQVDTIAHHTLK